MRQSDEGDRDISFRRKRGCVGGKAMECVYICFREEEVREKVEKLRKKGIIKSYATVVTTGKE